MQFKRSLITIAVACSALAIGTAFAEPTDDSTANPSAQQTAQQTDATQAQPAPKMKKVTKARAARRCPSGWRLSSYNAKTGRLVCTRRKATKIQPTIRCTKNTTFFFTGRKAGCR